MERKIGEIFEYNGWWYQAVKQTEKSCKACYFYSGEGCFVSTGLGWCRHYSRNDNKSVIFKKLEKVGEPYKLGKVLIQQYQGLAPVILPKNSECSNIFRVISSINVIEIEIEQNKEDMEENNTIPSNSENIGKNLKPFDLEAAKAGKPVCTRDGRKARIICFDAKRKDEKNIIALVPSKDYPEFEDLIAYPNNGNYHGGHENDGDLMMLPEKKEGWIVVRRSDIYENEERAKEALLNSHTAMMLRNITWEE